MRIMAIISTRNGSVPTGRRATNISLSATLVTEAKQRGINVSRACEEGLAQTVARARAAEWSERNTSALESNNDWLEKHGLPLEQHRMF